MAGFKAFFFDVFIDEYNALDNSVKQLADKKIKKILENPFAGKPLHGEPLRFNERFADSKYRIIYKIQGEIVKFAKIGKRDEVYR
ncbi:MAG: type II toxin-antitoxin system RelE/ParE family toxin [Candidatus Micrarchaeota archaeon]